MKFKIWFDLEHWVIGDYPDFNSIEELLGKTWVGNDTKMVNVQNARFVEVIKKDSKVYIKGEKE